MNTTRDQPCNERALTRAIAQCYSALRYEDLPEQAIRAAKQFMLDTLAVAWAGADAPGCGEARQVLLEEGGNQQATAWGWANRLPATGAAFLNGMASAALDFDSFAHNSPSHVNVVVLPAVLAMAESQRKSGKDVLTALVAGCDFMCRLGAASEAGGESHKGWFYTSVHGAFAAAAASARLLELDVEATLHALGIAYSQAGGTQQVIVEPGLSKRMGSAFAARAGVLAAALARRGVTAPHASIEGRYGLFNMYQPGNAARMLDGLGRVFENGNLSIKKFPSCSCNHAAIEAALQLTHEKDLVPEEISKIEVEISDYMDRLVGGPFEPRGDLQAAAQFNIRFSVACALIRRKFGLSELSDSVICDPKIRNLCEQVAVTVDPHNHGKRGPAVLRIHSRRHGVLSRQIDHVPGSAQSPLSQADIEAKCRDCFELGPKPLGPRTTEDLISRVWRVEEIEDMTHFFEGIA